MYVKLTKDIKIAELKYFKGLVINVSISNSPMDNFYYCGEKIPKTYTTTSYISNELVKISYIFEGVLSDLVFFKIKSINHLLNNPVFSIQQIYKNYYENVVSKGICDSIVEHYLFNEFDYKYKEEQYDSLIMSKTNSTFLHVLKLCFKYIDNNNIINHIEESYDGDDLNDIIDYLNKKSDLDNNNFKKYLKEFEYQENIDYIIDLVDKKLKVVEENKKIKEPIDKFEKIIDKPKKEILKQRMVAKKKLGSIEHYSNYLSTNWLKNSSQDTPFNF